MSNTQTQNLVLHPEAGRVPEMRPEEWKSFVEDVRERGIRVPIEVADDGLTILDGRSRWKAANELGITHIQTTLAKVNGDDPVVYMIRAASRRRQLSDDQRACLASEEYEYLKQKGEERRKNKLVPGAAHKSFVEVDATTTKKHSENEGSVRSRETAARNNNVPENKVKNAVALRKVSPDLHQEVKEGKRPLSDAMREARREAEERAAQFPIPDGPTPSQIARNSAAVKWAKNIHECWVVLNSIRDNGGVAKLASAWSDDERMNYVAELKQFRDAATEWISTLEKSCSKRKTA